MIHIFPRLQIAAHQHSDIWKCFGWYIGVCCIEEWTSENFLRSSPYDSPRKQSDSDTPDMAFIRWHGIVGLAQSRRPSLSKKFLGRSLLGIISFHSDLEQFNLCHWRIDWDMKRSPGWSGLPLGMQEFFHVRFWRRSRVIWPHLIFIATGAAHQLMFLRLEVLTCFMSDLDLHIKETVQYLANLMSLCLFWRLQQARLDFYFRASAGTENFTLELRNLSCIPKLQVYADW